MPTDAHPKLNLIPLPRHLEGVASLVRTWAKTKPKVHRVFLFGSTLKGKPDPSDLDLAVEYTVGDEGYAVAGIILDLKPWTRELERAIGRKVDLDLAHPKGAPTVWGYLCEGCALVFERQ